jgi:hypothetical protein
MVGHHRVETVSTVQFCRLLDCGSDNQGLVIIGILPQLIASEPAQDLAFLAPRQYTTPLLPVNAW